MEMSVSTRLIARLAVAIGFRPLPETVGMNGAAIAAEREVDRVQDIADHLAWIHDYLQGRVESLDNDEVAALPDLPETVPPRIQPVVMHGDASSVDQSIAA